MFLQLSYAMVTRVAKASHPNSMKTPWRACALIATLIVSYATVGSAIGPQDAPFAPQLNLFCGARINGSYTECQYLLRAAYAYDPLQPGLDTQTLVYVLTSIPVLPPFTQPILDVITPAQAQYQDPVDGISLAYAYNPANDFVRYADHYTWPVTSGLDVPLTTVTAADEAWVIDLQNLDGSWTTLPLERTPVECIADDSFRYAETPIGASPFAYVMDTHADASTFQQSLQNQAFPVFPAPRTTVPLVLNLSAPIAYMAAASEYMNQAEYVNIPDVATYAGTSAWTTPGSGYNVLGSTAAAPTSRGKGIPGTREITTFSGADSAQTTTSTSTTAGAQVRGTVSYHPPFGNLSCVAQPRIMLKTVGVASNAGTAMMPVQVAWSPTDYAARRNAFVPYLGTPAAVLPRPLNDRLTTAALNLRAYCIQSFDPTVLPDYLADAVPAADYLYPPKNMKGNQVLYALYAEDIPMDEWVVYAKVKFFWPTLNITVEYGPFSLSNFQRVFVVGDSLFAGPEDKPLVYLKKWSATANYTLEYLEANVVGAPYCTCAPWIGGVPRWNASGLLPCTTDYEARLNTPLDFTTYPDQQVAMGIQPSCMITLRNGFLNSTYATLQGGTYQACASDNLPLGTEQYTWSLASAGVNAAPNTSFTDRCFSFIPSGKTNNVTIRAVLLDTLSSPDLRAACELTVVVEALIPDPVIVINGTLAFRGGSPLLLDGTLSLSEATGEQLVYKWDVTSPVVTAVVNPYSAMLTCNTCNSTLFRPDFTGLFQIRLTVYPFTRPTAKGYVYVSVRILSVPAPDNFTQPVSCISIITNGGNVTYVPVPPFAAESLNSSALYAQAPEQAAIFSTPILDPTTPTAPVPGGAPVTPNDPAQIATTVGTIVLVILVFLAVVVLAVFLYTAISGGIQRKVTREARALFSGEKAPQADAKVAEQIAAARAQAEAARIQLANLPRAK